jgi:hypothetical protein
MSLPLSFHPAVRGEIDQAYKWYEARQTGLGDDFLAEVDALLGKIAANPALYGFVEGDIRTGQTRRFPYVVYYRALPDRTRVLAVYHASRDPSGWQGRT